ncbi:MAG: muconolactone delta-isomerase [Rhodoglobus sp.]|nr:muconolactone delta-isomerase [Rhodoglobus sp.]
MEWLVRLQISPPDGTSDAVVAEKVAAEAVAARAFAASGALVRIWRVPGEWASWSIWRFEDATAVHGALSSLPLWPWAQVAVHPLAVHPNDPATRQDPGGSKP